MPSKPEAKAKLAALEGLGTGAPPAESPAPAAPPAAPAPLAKSNHGGARPGAGRPPKAPAKPEPEERGISDEERAKRVAFYDANRDSIEPMFAELYGIPFGIAATVAECPEARKSPDVLRARAKTMFWVLKTFCPDWGRYMPVAMLGIAFLYDVSDTTAAIMKKKRAEKKARADSALPPVRPESPRAPTSPPLVQAPAPPAGAPPEISA